jgi:hypothetical protein
MRGVSPSDPIRLTTAAGEIQQLAFEKGWNWVSWYLRPASDALNNLFAVEQGFSEGDIVKSPTTQSFAELTLTDDTTAWMGSLTTTNYNNMYMVRTAKAFNTTIEGKALTDDQRTITLRNGWNSVAYLLSDQMSLKDALADYYDKATVGDIIKSRTQFAVFTENGKWEGSLQSLRPGQGYLLKRLAPDSVTMQFVQTPSTNAPKRTSLSAASSLSTEGASSFSEASSLSTEGASPFTNPNAATNMTMICSLALSPEDGLSTLSASGLSTINVFIGNELVGIATPIDSLYFITIQSDVTGGEVRFETEDGQELSTLSESGLSTFYYQANAHLGSLSAPILLAPVTRNPFPITDVFKVVEDDHVIIIRNGERYDVTGKKLE